jgi:hypothetical protein
VRLLEHGVRADLNRRALVNVRSVLGHSGVQELRSRDAVCDPRFANFRERLAMAAVLASSVARPLEASIRRPRHSRKRLRRLPTPNMAFLRTVYLEDGAEITKSVAQQNDVSHGQRIAGSALEGAVQQRGEADEARDR